jgi:hypothetical protein
VMLRSLIHTNMVHAQMPISHADLNLFLELAMLSSAHSSTAGRILKASHEESPCPPG